MNEDVEKLFDKAKCIKLSPVLSSNISGIGYNDIDRILVVLFKGGNKYVYKDVEPEVYTAIISSESIGKALNECVVRDKEKYKYYKLLQEDKTNENKVI